MVKKLLIILILCFGLAACGGDDGGWGQYFDGDVKVTNHGTYTELKGTLREDAWPGFTVLAASWYLLRRKLQLTR